MLFVYIRTLSFLSYCFDMKDEEFYYYLFFGLF